MDWKKFAPRDLPALCVDSGENLVRMGNRRFQDHPNIRFEVGRFEEFPLPSRHFDLIYAAQVFHWIPQPIGYEKCADVRKDGGFACESRIRTIAGGIEASNHFQVPDIPRVLWSQSYTAEYIGFLQTGNRFIQKPAAAHDGRIERPYLCVLYLAQKSNKTPSRPCGTIRRALTLFCSVNPPSASGSRPLRQRGSPRSVYREWRTGTDGSRQAF